MPKWIDYCTCSEKPLPRIGDSPITLADIEQAKAGDICVRVERPRRAPNPALNSEAQAETCALRALAKRKAR